MNVTNFLAAATPAAPTRLDPVELFLQADIVVQVVMALLLIASVVSWAIIIGFSLRIGRMGRANTRFERDFWESEAEGQIPDLRGKSDIASARVARSGMSEFKRSTGKGAVDRDGARERMATAMGARVAAEADTLADRLGFLATLGSVAPFVGLFGTVWGIMNSFFQIGAQQNSSLAVVAPGIAEALFATAIGLFAAIPAVIAYNRFSGRVNSFEARLQRFADRFHATLSREIETR
ncbi:protein TolQ [Alteriqipengyuania flavescens]|uniref:protein TolQ n=1 Tax=Alteriqipengyuania flavescens TaxID=3053610 RepID=UPI0025B295EA|nr:protein TolQ [Alteriqipengyuania flavescens]WJY17752.1 protein TolQ [Alteriqipengyuania flavescens]WJY23695.1 protein TolQ [Alteriqipengyuania flavescens]